MVELLSRDNVALREKLESVYLKISNLQTVSENIDTHRRTRLFFAQFEQLQKNAWEKNQFWKEFEPMIVKSSITEQSFQDIGE